MADWTIDVLSRDGGSTIATATGFRSARVVWNLDGPGSIDLTLRETDVTGGPWLPGRRRIRVKRLATTWWTGFQTNLARSGRPAHERYTAAGLGLASALRYRVVHTAFFLEDDADQIAWALIDNAQDQTDGSEGFTLGTTVGTPATRRRYYCEGDSVWDGIASLAERKTKGFDWEISPTGAFNVWIGGRGTDLSGSVSIAEADVLDWQVEEDTSSLLTYATAFGKTGPDGQCDELWETRSAGTAATYGRREEVLDLTDVDDATELQDAADDLLRARGAAQRRLRVAWIDGAGPWAFGGVWLGDVVSAELEAVFGGTQDMRLITVAVSLEPGQHAFVEHEFEVVP
jgi:hypothetical protein